MKHYDTITNIFKTTQNSPAGNQDITDISAPMGGGGVMVGVPVMLSQKLQYNYSYARCHLDITFSETCLEIGKSLPNISLHNFAVTCFH